MASLDSKTSVVAVPITGSVVSTTTGSPLSTVTAALGKYTKGEVSGILSDGPPFTSENNVGIVHTSHGYGIINGPWSIDGYVFVNYPKTGPSSFVYNPSIIDLSVTDFAASRDPSKPEVDLPAFVGELKDVPRLFKMAGQSILSRGWLQYSFGWKPLVSDLNRLLDFGRVVDERATKFHNIYNQGGYKASEKPLQRSSYIGPRTLLSGADNYFYGYYRQNRGFVHQWRSARWQLDHDPRNDLSTFKGRREAAFRSAYKITPDLASAWQLLPWSWLIDYFAQVGSYLQLRSNRVGLISSQGCLMTHTVAECIRSDEPRRGCEYSQPYYRSETKRRKVVGYTPLEGVQPFLTSGQALNLGAVISSKAKWSKYI